MSREDLLVRICGDLDLIAAAAAVPEGAPQVYVGPSWLWVEAARTGAPGSGTIPLRRAWSPAQVTGQDETLSWKVNVLGVKESGSIQSTDLPLVDAIDLRAQALAARTDLALMMQPVATAAVAEAAEGFRRSYRVGKVLSEETLESLVDEIVFSPEFDRVVERLLSPKAWRTDPLHWLNTDLRSHGVEAVRKCLGDSREGRRVRALSRELGTRDPDRIAAAFAERWPKSRQIGTGLIEDALVVVTDPMADYAEVLA